MKSFFLVYLFSVYSFAQTLSGPALFNRCYIHLTGKPVPIRNTTMLAIKQERATALIECQKLIDKVALDSNGMLKNQADRESKDILNNFQKFHLTWFGANTVDQIQEYGVETARGTMDIYDSTEQGLALTRALFSDVGQYRDVLTLESGMQAVREQDSAIKNRIGWSVDFPTRRLHGNNTNLDLNLFHFRSPLGFSTNADDTKSTFISLPKIQVGDLIGIRLNSQSAQIPDVSMVGLGVNKIGSQQPGLAVPFDLYKTFGGGVLGSPIYFMMNYGHGRDLKSDGATKVPRRWAMNSMQSFLCANFPVLRQSDIEQFYVNNSSGATAPFRKGLSCLQCHSTLDQMAYTARNLTTVNSDFFEFSSGEKTYAKSAIHLVSYKAENPSVGGWPSERVTDFHRQVPKGRLYFRSMSGQLIDKPLNGIASLGKELSDTDDYYNCAAKRYFKFFTGIDVALYDETDPNNADMNRRLTDADKNARKFIEDLGQQLKQRQSVKELIKSIMNSPYYSDTKYQPH